MDSSFLLLLFYLASSWQQEYYDYERRQKYQVNAYDWSYEEVPANVKKLRSQVPAKMDGWNLWWKSTPWAVGIRGKYSSDKFLFERCMGVMVQKYYVITFCSCVCSWYASNRIDENRVGVGVFRRPKTCDKYYDIRSGKIFTFFQYEIQPNGSKPVLVTDSLEVSSFDVPTSPNCDAAIDGHARSLKLYSSFVILVLNKAEVDLVLSVSITNMNPPWPPTEFDERFRKLSNITTYGAVLDKSFFLNGDDGKPISVDQRPVTVKLEKQRRPNACSHFAHIGEEGICFSVSLVEICGFLPGSPVIAYDIVSKSIKLIGLVQNHMSCYARDAAKTAAHVVPLTRAMELWETLEAYQATEKAQYDVHELPWDDQTTSSYIDLFPPDALKRLQFGAKSDGQPAARKEFLTIIFSLSVFYVLL